MQISYLIIAELFICLFISTKNFHSFYKFNKTIQIKI